MEALRVAGGKGGKAMEYLIGDAERWINSIINIWTQINWQCLLISPLLSVKPDVVPLLQNHQPHSFPCLPQRENVMTCQNCSRNHVSVDYVICEKHDTHDKGGRCKDLLDTLMQITGLWFTQVPLFSYSASVVTADLPLSPLWLLSFPFYCLPIPPSLSLSSQLCHQPPWLLLLLFSGY